MIDIETGDRDALDALIALIGVSFPEQFGEAWNAGQLASIISLPTTSIYLAKDNNLLVGFAITRTISDECELLLLAVRPEHRRKGIGKQLIDRLTGEARRASVSKLFLEMREGNGAEQLYARLGFRRIGCRKNYYTGSGGIHFDAITFGLSLK